jgi:hypothetical protein
LRLQACFSLPVANQAHFRTNHNRCAAPPQLGLEVGTTMGLGCDSWEHAMVERIKFELSDKSYEAVLAFCAVCGFVSLLLAATV